MNAVTKSGTNQLNGDIWEYLRNDDLQANGYFSKQNGKPIANTVKTNSVERLAARFTSPSFTTAENKTFFFFSYQGFAYRVNPWTVVRGGYGLAYGALANVGYGGTLGTNYPFIYNIGSPSSNTPVIPISLSNGQNGHHGKHIQHHRSYGPYTSQSCQSQSVWTSIQLSDALCANVQSDGAGAVHESRFHSDWLCWCLGTAPRRLLQHAQFTIDDLARGHAAGSKVAQWTDQLSGHLPAVPAFLLRIQPMKRPMPPAAITHCRPPMSTSSIWACRCWPITPTASA